MSLYVGALPADIERRRYAPAWDPVAGGIVFERRDLLRADVVVDVSDALGRPIVVRLFDPETAEALPDDVRRKLVPARRGRYLALAEAGPDPVRPREPCDFVRETLGRYAREYLRARLDAEAHEALRCRQAVAYRARATELLAALAPFLRARGYRGARLAGGAIVPSSDGRADLGAEGAARCRPDQLLELDDAEAAAGLPDWLAGPARWVVLGMADALRVRNAALNRRRKRPVSPEALAGAEAEHAAALAWLRRYLLPRGYGAVRIGRAYDLGRGLTRKRMPLGDGDPDALGDDAVFVVGSDD